MRRAVLDEPPVQDLAVGLVFHPVALVEGPQETLQPGEIVEGHTGEIMVLEVVVDPVRRDEQPHQRPRVGRPRVAQRIVGRADHRVKISGYRIELGEVEAALRRLPGVAEAVVVALTDAGGREVLAAAVRPGDPTVSVAGLQAALAGSLPEHMIPRQLHLVSAIAYTVAGKIDRRAVTAELAAAMAAGDGYRAPAGPLQRALAAILAEVLGADRVGADDDFFALGGDSVLATAAVSRIRTWLDAPAAVVADIFATRTVAGLAVRLAAAEADPGRLDAVAEVYLEVAQLDAAAVAEALQ